MTRSRLLLTSSFSLVTVGAVLALSTFVLGPARAAVGPLPAAALVLPSDARVVFGFDVPSLVKSPLYRRMKAREASGDPFRELRAKLGLDPERDLETVVIAAGGARAGEKGVLLAFGRFDRYALGRALEQQKGVTWKQHAGHSVYLFDETSRGGGALVFLSDDLVAVGTREAVEQVAANQQNGASLRANKPLMALLERVKPGSTFWMAGDQSALARLPLRAPGPGGGQIELPALQGVTVTGELAPALNLDVVGDATDAAAASKLADVVRGLLALATLQAGKKPELQQLAAAVSVTTEGRHVRVGLRLPYELLDSLEGRGREAAAVTE